MDVAQPLDREKGITVEDYKLIKMQMSNCMLSLSLSVFRFLILLGFNLIAKILFLKKIEKLSISSKLFSKRAGFWCVIMIAILLS